MTTISEPLKRVKRKVKKSQNPLFEKWLKEWRDEAKQNGTDTHYCFNKALKSLQKFPLPVSSGKECLMLENFGAKICKMLDDRLALYKSMHPEGVPSPKSINGSLSEIVKKTSLKRKSSDGSLKAVQNSDSEKNKSSKYVPAFRSGPYAILVTLLDKLQEENFKGYLTKSELQTEAQVLCDVSFTKPLPGSYYTAWSSMGVLLKKQLVIKEGNPAKFRLTNEGIELALKLKQVDGNTPIHPKPVSPLKTPTKSASPFKSPTKSVSPFKTPTKYMSPLKTPTKSVSPLKTSPYKKISKTTTPKKLAKDDNDDEIEGACSQTSTEPEETIFLLPGSFEIILLVDTQERDCKYQSSKNMAMKTLENRKVNFEIRHLKVGDFIWIARDAHGNELVLPYIVERKRMDDLGSSIKDGRFHEQKFRLKQSGVENLIYLVEKYGNENHKLGLPLPSLLQAISNTQIVNGFNVKVTNNHDDSMRYLDCMTTQLNNIFKNKTLMSCKKSNLTASNLSDDLISLMTFKDFNKGSEKNKKLTVRNMLVKHLIQLNGVSIEKANAIVQLCPTPKALINGLKTSSGEKSIADLTYGPTKRSVGPNTAKQIQMLYTSLDLK